MSLLKYLHDSIKSTFEEHPYRFFTEHDIHSQLNAIATKYLLDKGTLYVRSKDNIPVSRIHHEYPTPFRCLMGGIEFELITEEEFEKRREYNPKFRARRGFIDLVVLNPEFISQNPISVICGKDYDVVLKSMKRKQLTAIDIAIEVVYFAVFDNKPHRGIMKRRVDSARQDYEKLQALMEFTYPDHTAYCEKAALMFLSNTKYKEDLRELLQPLESIGGNVSFYSISRARGAASEIF